MSEQSTEKTQQYPMCAPDCEERTACASAGAKGHHQCGVCTAHYQPRHHCGCMFFPPGQATS